MSLLQSVKCRVSVPGRLWFEGESGLAEGSGDEACRRRARVRSHCGGAADVCWRRRGCPGCSSSLTGAFDREGVDGQLYDCQPVQVAVGESSHLPVRVCVEIVPDHDDLGVQVAVRDGDQGCAVCLVMGAAGSRLSRCPRIL